MTRQELIEAVTATLGDHAAEFDVNGMVEEIGSAYARLEDVPNGEYFRIAKRHHTEA